MFEILNRILGRSGQAQPIEDPESVLPEYYFVPRGRDEVVVAVGDEQRDQLLAKTQEKGVEMEPVIPVEVDLGRPIGENNPVRFVVLSKSPRDAARVILKAKRMGAKSLRLPNPYDAELDIYDPNNPIGKEYLSLIGANLGEEQAGWAGNLWEGVKQASAKAGDAVRSVWGAVKDKASDAGEYIQSILPNLSGAGTKPDARPYGVVRPPSDAGDQPMLRATNAEPAPTPIIVPSPTASSRNVEKELAELSKESNRPSVPAPVGVTSQTQSSLAVIQQLDQRAKDEYLANILEAASKEEEAARLAAQIQKPKGVLGYLKLAKAALATGAGEYAKNLLAGISANLYGRDAEPPDQRARDAERRILSELQPYMTPQGGFDLARAYSDERRSYKPVPPEQKVQEEAQNIAFEQRAQQALREASQKLYEVGTSINKLVSDEDRALVSKVLSEPTTLKNLPDQIVAGFLSNIYYYLASALAMKLPNVAGPAAATGSIMLTEQGAKYDELIKELTKRGVPLDRAVEIAAAESFRYGVESGAVEQASNAAQLLTVIKALRSARNPSELARTLQKSPVKEFFKTLFKTVSTEAAEGGVQEWRSNVASERVEQRTGLEDLPKGDPLRAAFLEGISASPVGIVAASARGYAQHKANKINEQMSQPRPAESGAEEQESPKTEETTDDQAAKTPTDEDAGRGDQKEAQSAAVDSSVAVDAKQESAEPAAKSAGVDVSVEPNIVNILEGEPGGISTWKPEEIERLTTALDYARTVADGVARQYQNVDPDDLYQELIGVSINASKKYQPGDVPFRSYLSVVFRNKIRDVLRASKRGAETRPLSLDAESESTGATIANTTPAPKREAKSTIDYLQDAVQQIVAEMPDGNDKAILQGYLEGKSDDEIRKNVLKPDGTPYSREYVRQRKLQLIPEFKKRARARAEELMARDESEAMVPEDIEQPKEGDAAVAETGDAPPVMPRVSYDQVDAANRAIEEIRKKVPDIDILVHWFANDVPLYQQLVDMYKAAGKSDAEATARAEAYAKQFADRVGRPSEWQTIPAGAHHRGANIAFDKAAKRVEIWLLKNGKLPAGVDTVVHEIAESLSRDLVADPEHAAMIRENRDRWTQWLENVAAKAEGKQKQRALEARSVLAAERSLNDAEWLSRRFEDHWIQKWYSVAPNNTSAFKRLLNSFVQWARDYVEYLYARVLLFKKMSDDGVLDQRLISVLESFGRARATRASDTATEQTAVQADKPYAVFAVARLPSGKIAATTRAADRGEEGRIGLPGGKVAEGEDPITALKREAMEEGWEIDVDSDTPIHKAMVEGKPVWWYAATPVRKLEDYKEKGRISPLEATVEQIAQSGYGNEFIPDYLSRTQGPTYQAQRVAEKPVTMGQHGRDYGTKLITGEAQLPPMQKRRVEEIAAIFEEETRRKDGVLQLDNMSNREIEDFADALERFVRASAELHPEARNWYRGTLSAAIDIAQRAHPELSQEEYRNVFIVLLSAFSNSEEVGRNWANAVTAYRLFRANNDAFVDIPTVARSAPISKLYSALESMRRKVGLPGLIQFLRSKGTVGELATRASEMMGIPYSEAKSMFGDVLVEFPTYGFGIMGPKLGMFAASNAGMPDALVLDRWMQRLNGRIAGSMFLRRSEESIKQIRERMESAWEAFSGKATGRKLIDALGIPADSGLEKIAKRVERLAGDPEVREILSRTKAGDELRKAANLFVQAHEGELIEVPKNARERYNMLLSYRRVAERLGMTIPEVQATAWYGEKELYWAMGTSRYTESADYYAAARAWYKEQYNEDIPADQRFTIGNIGRLLKKHGVKHHFSTHQDREPMFQSQYVYDINDDGDYELRPTVGYADEAMRLAYSLGVKALPEDRDATIPNMAASLWERAIVEGDPSLALAAEIMINESKDPRRVRLQAGSIASDIARPYILWEQPYEPLERLVNATRHVISPYSLLLAMNGPVVDDGWVVVLKPSDIRAAAFAALEAADAENIDVSKVNVVVLTPEPKLYVDVPIESARDGTVEGGKELALGALQEEGDIRFQAVSPDERREIEVLSQQADEYIRTLGYLPSKKPGVPSRLTKHQWVQVRTTNFKKWFGDWENDPQNASKVVDSVTGEPMVLTKLPSFVAGRLHTMPYKFIQEIESWDYVSQSPYSYSFYNKPGKTWDHTPEGIIRISDHWNFISRGQMHAVTDVPVPNETHWTKARYENGVWRVLEVLPADQGRRSNIWKGIAQVEDMNKAAEASSERRAVLTLRTWERSRGRFKLVDEHTVEGRVIKKTPHMVTIMTDDGVIYRGKNYVLSELPYEKQAKFYLNDRTGEIKSADINVGTFGQRPPTDEEAAQYGMTREQAAEAQAQGDIRFQEQRTLADYASAPETIKQVQRDQSKSMARRFAEYALLSLDTQAKMIGGDTLRASLREMIDREELYNAKYKPIVEEFDKNIKKLSKKDHNAVWLALYNGDWSVAEQIFRNNRSTQNYTLGRLREMLNEIHSRAADVGMEIGYIENYFPRTVRSYKELAKHFSALLGTIAESDIYMAVNEFVKQEGRPPTTQELAKLIRALIEGRYRSGSRLPTYVKSRKLPDLDFALLKYYEKPADSLALYVRLMNSSISRREWLGRMSDAIARHNPYAALSYRRALADYRRALIYYDMLLEDPNASADDIQRAAEMVEQLRTLTSINSGISMVLADMVRSGMIPADKHNDALRLIQRAITPETRNRFFDGIRALANALGLGSWITAIRNVGDLSVSFVSQGLGPTVRAILGGGPIRWKDLGYERLQADIDAESAGWSDRIQNFYLTVGGTTAISRYGQRVLANAATIRARSLAKRYLQGSSRAGRKLAFLVEKAFTSGLTPELAVRLADKQINESIVQMGRWAVSQVQGVDTLAMPQLYREHPIARFVYQWRNWLLRYYNFIYADGILEIAQGIRAKNLAQVQYGLRNVVATLPAAWLTQVLMTMVINTILGRDDEPDDVAEQELWNLLFFNRYQTYLIEQGRLREAMWSMIAPSIGLLGVLEKDIRMLIRRGGALNSAWELRILRNLTPGIGRIIDAYHPAGSGEARRQVNPADYRRVKELLERRDIPASLVPEMRKLSALSRKVEEARDIGDYEAAERLATQLRMAANLTRRSMTEQRLKQLEQRARALEEKERRRERIARALAAQRN